MLPGTTIHAGGPWARISDPAVAYDAEHDVWMISGLAFGTASSPFGSPRAILTSRSTDGGLTWQDPVTVSLSASRYDKNWIACDNWVSSPYYGNCYTEWDDNGQGNLLLMSTSTDGGLTWGPALTPAGSPSGLGGQPIVQPNGTRDRAVFRELQLRSERSAPRTAVRRGRARCWSRANPSTASPAAFAILRSRRPRSTGRGRCTSSGTTVASGPAAPRTTSS